MPLQDTVFREGKTETKSLLPQQVQKTEPLISKAPAEIRLFGFDCRDGLPADIPEGGSAGCLFLPGHDLVRTFFII